MNSLHERKNWISGGLKGFFLKYKVDYVRIIENCGETGGLNRLLGTEHDNRQAIEVWKISNNCVTNTCRCTCRTW